MSRASVQTAPLPLAPTLAWPSARPRPLAAYHGTRLSSIRAPGPGSGVCQSAAPRRRSQASKQEAVPERPRARTTRSPAYSAWVVSVDGLCCAQRGRIRRTGSPDSARTRSSSTAAPLDPPSTTPTRSPAISRSGAVGRFSRVSARQSARPVPPSNACTTPSAASATTRPPPRARHWRQLPWIASDRVAVHRAAPVASARASSRSRNATSTRSPSSQRRTRPASGPVTPSRARSQRALSAGGSPIRERYTRAAPGCRAPERTASAAGWAFSWLRTTAPSASGRTAPRATRPPSKSSARSSGTWKSVR